MIRYAVSALLAQVRRARLLFALTVLGVALGIASVLSIQVINRSALAAFRGGIQAVSGEADLSVLPRTLAMPESLYAGVLATSGVRAAWPLYEVSVALGTASPPAYLDVVGTDLLAGAGIPFAGEPGEIGDALARPGWIAVSPELARAMGWHVGSAFTVSSGSRTAVLTVGALVDFRRLTPLAGTRLAVMDIAQAQALLGTRGQLTQVDVRTDPGRSVEVAHALTARLGPGVEVLRPEQRERRAEGLIGAFRLNLTALSLISLVVGFFLVHTTTQAALVRRRTEFGVLRANGATRLQVFGIILGEVALLGLLGVAVGLPVGLAVAKANLGVVSATLTNLYLLSAVERLDVPAWLYALAVGLGLLGAVVGALGPALDVARGEVRDLLSPLSLHESTAATAGGFALGAAGLLTATAAWYAALGHDWQPAGFVWAVAILLAIPLATPWLLLRVTAPLRPRRFGLAYSVKSLGTRLQTTAFAVASLAIAVSMLVGITVMVASFRDTVTVWLDEIAPAQVDLHNRTLRFAVASRALKMRMGFVIASGATRLAILLTTPGAQALAVPVAYKFVTQVLAQVREYQALTSS